MHFLQETINKVNSRRNQKKGRKKNCVIICTKMDLVDIDKLIDELEGSESVKPSTVVSNASQVGSLPQAPAAKKNPVSSVFSSLNDYVNSAIESPAAAEAVAPPKRLKNGKESIRKFSNPNYAYDDINLSSDEDSEVVEQQLRERLAKQESQQESHATTYFESSTSSSSGTAATSTDDSPLPTIPMGMSADLSTLTLSNDVMGFDGISSEMSMVEITSNYYKLRSDCKDESSLRKEEDRIQEEDIASKTSDMIIGLFLFAVL